MHRVRMLQHFGVQPYMVFDGDYLPSKAATEDSRAQKREEKKKLATDLLKAGKPSQAAQEFQKCVDITPEMASTLIQELKKLGISYVVAPYEADAQLVYLEKKGLIDGILSDDSDLLVFGAKRLLTKLDQYGNCIEINRRDFCACREVSLTGWSDAEFRRMAILSGCDYLNGLPGVGLKTAYRMLRKSKTPERVVRMLQFDGKRVSENYLTQFYQAELTFLHQWVFCPSKKELVHLTDLDGTRTAIEMPFIGAAVDKETAQAIARGDMNPITKQVIHLPLTPSKRKLSMSRPVATSMPPHKPITSFFKTPSRVPMGEMDPNCFSIDKERVAQLTDGGLVPRVFPLPRPYIESNNEPASADAPRTGPPAPRRTSPRLNRRRTEPIGDMLSRVASSPLMSRHTPPTAGKSTGRTPQSEPAVRPPKKARLCDDTEVIDTSPKSSKFFSAAKKPASPRRTKSEAYLFSDDSIEEALQGLPDVETWTPASSRSKPRISIFDDASQDTQSTGRETSSLTETSLSSVSQADTAETPSSSMEPSMLPPKSTLPLTQRPANTPSTAATSLSRFSYSSSRRSTSSTPASNMSSRSSVFSAVATPSTAATRVSSVSSSSVSRMTPLQRMGANASNNSPRFALPSKKPSRPAYLGSLPVNPSFVPLPKVDLDEVEALHRPCGGGGGGSEDQIIPDSDGEDNGLDDNNSEEARLPEPKKLDLSQFAFS